MTPGLSLVNFAKRTEADWEIFGETSRALDAHFARPNFQAPPPFPPIVAGTGNHGIIGLLIARRAIDITDGTSNTIMFGSGVSSADRAQGTATRSSRYPVDHTIQVPLR